VLAYNLAWGKPLTPDKLNFISRNTMNWVRILCIITLAASSLASVFTPAAAQSPDDAEVKLVE